MGEVKIVVLDAYAENPGDISWAGLEKLGKLTIYDRTSNIDSPLIAERIGDAQIAIINKTPITRNTIDKCPNLKSICVFATGYNVVDCDYAKQKGIWVQNVPVYGSHTVSQYTIGLLMEACSHIGHHSDCVHNGDWEKCEDFCFWNYPMLEVSGKTAGIIGLGKIGVNTAQVLKALHMNVLAYNPSKSEEGKSVAEYVDLDRLFKESDFIFLHCPLFPDTEGIINKDNINKMKDGVVIINSSRGGLVVEQDLCDALNSGKVAVAAVDVVSVEPIKGDNPLLKAKNCIITPHIAWATTEARIRIMETTVENVKSALDNNPINVVNK